MEKDRSSKVIAIIALIVGVIGLSLGFALYADNLSIAPSADVEVNEDEAFKIVFSNDGEEVVAGKVKATVVGQVAGANADEATIDNSGDPTISGLSAHFTAPGQSATYRFYVANDGALTGYLHSIVYGAAEGSDFKVCTAGEGTTKAYVDAACDAITVTVDVHSISTTSGQSSIQNKSLSVGDFEEITVKIEYAANGAATDGDFSVKFGKISLDYSTVQ